MIDKVEKKLECCCCLSTLCEPHMLACNHQFCKKCLDGLLVFHDDGSAFIECPQGCSRVTGLSCDETTNDLYVDYRVCDIVDVVEGNERRGKPMCETCKGDASKSSMAYCTSSKKFKCEKCVDPQNVDLVTGNPLVPVKFDLQEGGWEILCEEHNTIVDSMCCDTLFVCVYCRHRNHRGHTDCETLDDAQEKLRELLGEGLRFLRDYHVSHRSTNRNVTTVRSTLEELLKVNKMKRMEEYLRHLNEQEEQIRREFNAHSQAHTGLYNRSDRSPYFKECLQMDRLQLLVRKADITDLVNAQYRVIRETSVSLTDSTFDDHHPLGHLVACVGDHVPIDQSSNSFQSDLSNAHMQLPCATRATFSQSPNIRKYIQGLRNAIEESENAQEAVVQKMEEPEEQANVSTAEDDALLALLNRPWSEGEDYSGPVRRGRRRLDRRAKRKATRPSCTRWLKKPDV